jgi:4,5-dihydroxyphthalate decarboxylase
LAKLRLNLACEEYDRTRRLLDGTVQPDGIEIVAHKIAPQETFARMLGSQEFDVAEMSISYYLTLRSSGKASFTAIPVFPMRMFFHTKLLCRPGFGISAPPDLNGIKIGVEEYGMSLAIWIRAILQHEFLVPLNSVEWFVKSVTNRNVAKLASVKPPPDIRIQLVPSDANMMAMLSEGKIDAAFPYARTFRTSPGDLQTNREAGNKLAPLFDDAKGEAVRYFKKTGFFPMNHVIVVRERILEDFPWASIALLDAFQRSKELSYEEAATTSSRPTNFVWLEELHREVESLFGDDPYPYGFRANRKSIGALIGYAQEQGIVLHKMSPEDLFADNTLDS